jgi:hypothetical protein
MDSQSNSEPGKAVPNDYVRVVRQPDGELVLLSPYKGCVRCLVAAIQSRKSVLDRARVEFAARNKQAPVQKFNTAAELSAKLNAIATLPISESDRVTFDLKMAIQDATDGPQLYSPDGEKVYHGIEKPVCTCGKGQG